MTALVFMDTETTGLSLDDDIWEFYAIKRRDNGDEMDLHLFIEHDEAKCARLPEPFLSDHKARYDGSRAVHPSNAARQIARLFEDRPHVVGAVPNFDTERLTRLLEAHGYKPGWHYHLIDVENLAVGWLFGYTHGQEEGVVDMPLPWDSDKLSAEIGVTPPEQGDGRHTAVGDVFWARAIFDKVTEGSQLPSTTELSGT